MVGAAPDGSRRQQPGTAAMTSRPAIGVTGTRSRSLAVARAAVLACLVAGLVPGVSGGASPSPAATPAVAVDLTGHWAVAGTSGFDIDQDGSRIDGASVAGIRFSGTVSGAGATFRFWSGTSYAKVDPDDRGSGSFRVTPDGRTLVVSWHSEKPSATYPPLAQLRSDAQAYEAMLYLFRERDRAHGIEPRPEP
jgi:hypothetical protein